MDKKEIIAFLDKNYPGMDVALKIEGVDYMGNHVSLGWFLAIGTTHVKYGLRDLMFVFDSKAAEVSDYVSKFVVVHYC